MTTDHSLTKHVRREQGSYLPRRVVAMQRDSRSQLGWVQSTAAMARAVPEPLQCP